VPLGGQRRRNERWVVDFVYDMPVSIALLQSRGAEPLLRSYLATHGYDVI
jgi:hypothetical protein